MASITSIRSSRARWNSSPTLDSDSSTAAPMAIPRARESVPPPLPPPTSLPEISASNDPGWQWGNAHSSEFGRKASVNLGSSLLGDNLKKQGQEHDHSRQLSLLDQRSKRGSISPQSGGRNADMTIADMTSSETDDASSIPSMNTELQGEKELRQRTLGLSSHTYDKHLLSRIGGPDTPKRQSLSYTSAGVHENGHLTSHATEQRKSSLQSLSVPESRHGSIDSSSSLGWPPAGISWNERIFPSSVRGLASRQGSVASYDSGSHRGSYDQSMFVSEDFHGGQISNLHLDDQNPGSPKAGSKRRASSPPRERGDRVSVSSAPAQGEMPYRQTAQHLHTRISPVLRHHPDPMSLSSTSSNATRHGSLGSSFGFTSAPSSATSYGSGRLSPSLGSTPFEVQLRNAAPRLAPNGQDSSPLSPHHQRTLSESAPSTARKLSTDSMSHSRKSSLSQLSGLFVCECCPKKPRKFETEDELRSHENEKQYTCAYCSNRFKNKNEAERHQNSLHLRAHSWQCAALPGIEAAFQASSSTSNLDMCGYCGQEFTNPPEWEARTEHLNQVHKYGECNQVKKFYRADHFRQHLKHSHHGTSGKWTNILETACMKDEPLPEKRISPTTASAMTPVAPKAIIGTPTGVSGPGPPPPATETIQETPHDS